MPKGSVLVTRKQYAQFLEYYDKAKQAHSEYRLGQAFLNYFPKIGVQMVKDTNYGVLAEYRLFNETDNDAARERIEEWVESHD